MRLKSSCNRRRHPASPHKQKHPVSHNPAFRDNFFFFWTTLKTDTSLASFCDVTMLHGVKMKTLYYTVSMMS